MLEQVPSGPEKNGIKTMRVGIRNSKAYSYTRMKQHPCEVSVEQKADLVLSWC